MDRLSGSSLVGTETVTPSGPSKDVTAVTRVCVGVCVSLTWQQLSVETDGVFFQAALASRDTPEQLIIALEPEAASIYCRKLRLHQMVDLGTRTTHNDLSTNDNVGSGMTQGNFGPADGIFPSFLRRQRQ